MIVVFDSYESVVWNKAKSEAEYLLSTDINCYSVSFVLVGATVDRNTEVIIRSL